jgi:membrane protease YdiL (CAAX protease family)
MSASSNSPKTAVSYGLILTVFLFAICVLASIFLPGIAGRHISPQVLFFITRLLFWISLALVYFYCIKIEKRPLLLWNEEKHSVGFYLISVIAILIIVFIGSGIIYATAHHFGLNAKSNAVNAMLKFGIPLKLFIILTAAVVEELIFRGYLMPRLQSSFKSIWWPIIISALIFGFAHFRYGTIVNVAGPVFIGFVFAWFYQKYRNIKIVIICHFLIDFIALMFLPQ